jgi:hypothetical protein
MDEKLPMSDPRGVPDEILHETSAKDTRSHRAKRTEYLHYTVLCYSLFLAGASRISLVDAPVLTRALGLGWNDGTTGPLLPRIQEVYNVS